MNIGNLYQDSAAPARGERFDALLSHRNLVIERIVSSGLAEPVDYVQEQDEWVTLLQGHAVMTVDGERVELQPGDHLFLPAGMPHRVEQTSVGAVWLAVHLHQSE